MESLYQFENLKNKIDCKEFSKLILVLDLPENDKKKLMLLTHLRGCQKCKSGLAIYEQLLAKITTHIPYKLPERYLSLEFEREIKTMINDFETSNQKMIEHKCRSFWERFFGFIFRTS